jgi:hypothetical protein
VVWAKPHLLAAQQFFEERAGLVPLSRRKIGAGQVVHPIERTEVVGTELLPRPPQRFLQKRHGPIQLPQRLVDNREVVHAGERVGMIEAEPGLALT